MSESTTTIPVDDAAEPGPLGLGGPVPQPIAPTGPVPIAIPIPDGEPAAAALQLLNAVRPDAPSLLAGRIANLTRQIDDQVEEYRLHTKGSLAEFIGLASRRVKLSRALEARVGRPSAGSAASEVLELVRSVKRFRPAQELKAERARIVDRLRGELAGVELAIRSTLEAASAGHGFAMSGPAAAAGFDHDHDEVLRRLEASLTTRKALRERLARVDSHGDGGRGALVRDAIDATGGVDALVASLAPRMQGVPGEGPLDKLRRDIDGLAGQLERIDDESRLAGELKARLEGLQSRLPELQATVRRQQAETAFALVAAAIAGDLACVKELESAVQSLRPALASQLSTIRASDADLVNVIAEIIGS